MRVLYSRLPRCDCCQIAGKCASSSKQFEMYTRSRTTLLLRNVLFIDCSVELVFLSSVLTLLYFFILIFKQQINGGGDKTKQVNKTDSRCYCHVYFSCCFFFCTWLGLLKTCCFWKFQRAWCVFTAVANADQCCSLIL